MDRLTDGVDGRRDTDGRLTCGRAVGRGACLAVLPELRAGCRVTLGRCGAARRAGLVARDGARCTDGVALRGDGSCCPAELGALVARRGVSGVRS